MNSFRFESPWWLLLLAILPMLRWLGKRNRPAALLFSSRLLLQEIPVSLAQRVGWILPWVRTLGLVLLIVALARPQAGHEDRRIQTEGIAIQMVIDKSGSMRAMDFTIDNQRASRIEAVKKVFRDFVLGDNSKKGRLDDQIGLIAFGGFAECVCPLTLDHATLVKLLDTVRIPEPTRSFGGRRGDQQLLNEELETAIGDGVVLACDRLKDAKAKSKVIILLSDGDNNAGVATPEEAAEVAKKLGLHVYCIGVGSTRGTRMPIQDMFGRLTFSSQLVRLDDRTLRAIANTTGGHYWNAEDSQTLAEIYAEIDKLEKTQQEGRVFVHYRELFAWPLIAGAGLVMFEWLCRMTRWRKLP